MEGRPEAGGLAGETEEPGSAGPQWVTVSGGVVWDKTQILLLLAGAHDASTLESPGIRTPGP